MCDSDIENTDTTDIHLFDAGALTFAQVMGDACAVCHARWPRPRRRLGASSEGGPLFGCEECAGFAADYASSTLHHALAAH
ncbi:hypothetical protein FZ103_13330 [Streptomonospora sp. PA3]|nr:hypothetical protein [Streptomonospora sp. PA3]MUL42149.1 hypothetical protein [Streptomonospora sp. PA3]